MKQQKKSAARQRRLLFRLGVLCCAFYGIIYLVQLQTQIAEKQAQIDALDAQIAQDTEENAELRNQVENGVTDEYIASVARDQYGYIMPNERVFADPSSK